METEEGVKPIIDFIKGVKKPGRPQGAFVTIQTKLGPRQRRLTQRQILYFQYLATGLSKRQAQIKAGYSLATANGDKVTGSVVIKAAAQEITAELKKQGISPEYLAGKFKQWFEHEKVVAVQNGQKITHPDAEAQMKAYGLYKETVEPKEDDQKRGFKKTITLEEFTFGENVTKETA